MIYIYYNFFGILQSVYSYRDDSIGDTDDIDQGLPI